MSPTQQIRLFTGVAALTLGLALFGGLTLRGEDVGRISVEGAIAWISPEAPDRLDVHIRLLNLAERPDAVVGVAAAEEFAAALCRESPLKCGPGAEAPLASGDELTLAPEAAAYVSLATGGRPFREGEVTLIELVLASGARVPVDLMVRAR